MDWTREFPGLTHGTYLNSCAYGLLPERTRRAVEKHLTRWSESPSWDAWTDEVARARAAFARLIHAKPEEVAIQANATSGTAAVMNALQPAARRRLVTMHEDFPASPALARRQTARGFEHAHVAKRDWIGALSRETALACAPVVVSFTGERLDVRALADAAHEKGAPILVDAFQAAGTYDIDVKRDDVDFLVTGTYKWLMGACGLAFLYAKDAHHELEPTTSGWYALTEPYEFDPLSELAPDARRFEYGGASIIGCAAASASLDLLHEVGVANVERHNKRLVDRVLEGAHERKYEILTPDDPARRASIVTFRVPDLDASLAALKREGVVVNTRVGGIRVSPHFYNSEKDVARLFEVLDGV